MVFHCQACFPWGWKKTGQRRHSSTHQDSQRSTDHCWLTDPTRRWQLETTKALDRYSSAPNIRGPDKCWLRGIEGQYHLGKASNQPDLGTPHVDMLDFLKPVPYAYWLLKFHWVAIKLLGIILLSPVNSCYIQLCPLLQIRHIRIKMIGKHLHLLLRPMKMHLMILIGYAYHHSLSSFYPTSFLAIYRNSMMFCALVPYPLPISDMFLGYPHPTSLILLAGYGLSSVMGITTPWWKDWVMVTTGWFGFP